jgi:peroxiredoxin (alkyl hydroperoxide reductase subunit C)
MAVLVGQQAPPILSNAVVNGEIVSGFSLDQSLGKKNVVFFFYPKDFTYVCPTELHAFNEKLAEFEKRETAVVACSTDTAESHAAYLRVPKAQGGIEGIQYPIVADSNKTIATNYDVINGDYEYTEDGHLTSPSEMVAYRGLFLIDKQGVVQHQLVNNLPLGRNVDEALRMVDALRHHEEKGEVCPANWSEGKDAMDESTAGVASYLASH